MFFSAIELNDFKFVYCLLKKDIDLDIKDKNNFTPLHLAVLKGRYEIVKLLLEKGANLNIQNDDGYVPLCCL
jgi:ankyrin repeat protein